MTDGWFAEGSPTCIPHHRSAAQESSPCSQSWARPAEPYSRIVRNEVTSNPFVWGALGLCTALLLAVVYLPGLAGVPKLELAEADGWALVLGFSAVPLIVGPKLQRHRGSPGAPLRVGMGDASDDVDVGSVGLGMLLLMFFWGLLIAGVVLAVKGLLHLGRGPGVDRALDILRERYALGEIKKDECDSTRRDLG